MFFILRHPDCNLIRAYGLRLECNARCCGSWAYTRDNNSVCVCMQWSQVDGETRERRRTVDGVGVVVEAISHRSRRPDPADASVVDVTHSGAVVVDYGGAGCPRACRRPKDGQTVLTQTHDPGRPTAEARFIPPTAPLNTRRRRVAGRRDAAAAGWLGLVHAQGDVDGGSGRPGHVRGGRGRCVGGGRQRSGHDAGLYAVRVAAASLVFRAGDCRVRPPCLRRLPASLPHHRDHGESRQRGVSGLSRTIASQRHPTSAGQRRRRPRRQVWRVRTASSTSSRPGRQVVSCPRLRVRFSLYDWYTLLTTS